MRIVTLEIRNFKSIRQMKIEGIENALIFVGKNNTGKTAVLDAIRAVGGDYTVRKEDFQEDYPNVEVFVELSIEEEDLKILHQYGVVSSYRRWQAWKESFCRKLPSYQDGILRFTFIANREGKIRYSDGVQKNNAYIPKVFPQIYYIDIARNLEQFQEGLLLMQEDDLLKQLRAGTCMFERAKTCNHCFSCIGLINQKKPEEINALEAARLLDFKLYQLNLDEFSRKVNRIFHKNGGQEEILYAMNRDVEKMLSVNTYLLNQKQGMIRPVEEMGKGMRSIYMLSLLESYAQEEDRIPGLILVEEPEIFSPSADAEGVRRDSLPPGEAESGDFRHPFSESPGEFPYFSDPPDGPGRGWVLRNPGEDGYQCDSG